jgi:hypothetical protein
VILIGVVHVDWCRSLIGVVHVILIGVVHVDWGRSLIGVVHVILIGVVWCRSCDFDWN